MNILLVSQCDKRALTETRRILDQFAERRGDRTWQTPITHAGLDTLRRLLKKNSKKKHRRRLPLDSWTRPQRIALDGRQCELLQRARGGADQHDHAQHPARPG